MSDPWERWDAAVDEYCAALEESRMASQTLKANYASRFRAYKSTMGVEEAKQAVYNDPDYNEAVLADVGAEVRMQRAKLNLEKMRLKFEEWRTKQANARAIG